MPIYEFKCSECGICTEKFLPLSEYLNVPECCEKPMERMLSAPAAIIQDNTCYRSQLNGQMITSRRQHRTHLKEHGCIEVGNEIPKGPPKPIAPPPGLKEAVIDAVNKVEHKMRSKRK